MRTTPSFSISLVSLFTIYCFFTLVELTWIIWIANDWYMTEMQGLLRAEFISWPWLTFYLIYGFALFYLAVLPNRDKPARVAALSGALLGMASYGAYNLTNHGLLEGFSLKIMLIDWCWGTVLSSFTAVAGRFAFDVMKKVTAQR